MSLGPALLPVLMVIALNYLLSTARAASNCSTARRSALQRRKASSRSDSTMPEAMPASSSAVFSLALSPTSVAAAT
ncbi:MAG: hypothetical protein L6Q74_02125 [Sphaerotilus natans subsp. sulfidivorans]|uniref:hypothetical protein n=1 Tax=Sphaerotilus sulfidivorans TaxID=639200 RepID=UPI0023553E9B|nr:hypothetical protein [Sphaerotilus sulfidivorans]MCK6400703.1 hypothetical protein [Sphaerotilus sulfidivorans]